MKCYSSYCRNDLFNHSYLHYTQSLHPIVVNIKEELIENDNSNNNSEAPKLTKLAIGKPGGAEIPSENYNKR